jgi:hypothetical protein
MPKQRARVRPQSKIEQTLVKTTPEPLVESQPDDLTALIAPGFKLHPVHDTVENLQRLQNGKLRQQAFDGLGNFYSNSYLKQVARQVQTNRPPSPASKTIARVATSETAKPAGDDQETLLPPELIENQVAAELNKVEAINPEMAREKGGVTLPNVPEVPPQEAPPKPKPAPKAKLTPPEGLVKPKAKSTLLKKKPQLRLAKLLKSAPQKLTKAKLSAPKAPPPPKIAAGFKSAGKGLVTLAKKLVPKRTAKKPLARLLQGGRPGINRLMRLLASRGIEIPLPQSQTQASTVQRAAACAEAPAKPKLSPEQDPGFKTVKGKAIQAGKDQKSHAPAKAKANEAQAAAQGPANEVQAQASVSQVEEMGQQKPGNFDKQAFVNVLQQAIEAITPKNQEQADEFKKSGKAGEIKGKVSNIVADKKKETEKDIKETSEAAPDPSKAKDGPKPVTPMQPEEPGQALGPLGAQSAMPKPKTAQEVSLEAGKCQVDSKMEEAGVTEEQLNKSNEPQFQKALKDKKEVETNAATAPEKFRNEEQGVLQQSQNEAEVKSTQALSGMNASRAGVLNQVAGAKTNTKGTDEQARAKVTAEIESCYNTTKEAVTQILSGLDGKVNSAFENGEKEARSAFENLVESRMNAYKKKRYDGPGGWVQWGIDKVMGMPDEVNAFYQEGRNLYLKRMAAVIDKVADITVGELNKAKARIEQGRKEINDYVAGLSPELKKIGQEAQENIQSKFDQLDQDVNSKQDELVQSLAQKYVEARNAVDERIKQMKDENKGLVDKAKEAVGGVIDTINNLKNMLLGVLVKAGNVIDKIIKDPIGFLGNLVNAIGTGLRQFMGNIGTHLKKGLMGWLFGALGEAGLQLPENFDLKGILSLVMQVLGLTYENIRQRAVAIVGEKTVSMIEKTVEIFKILMTEGPAGIWKLIMEKISSLKETILGGIMDFVKEKIIVAGITWIIGLLNPASAFIKACKAIYDIIMFFVERGSQIMELVNAIIDSVGAIAAGSIGQAANFVENALSKALPVAISFLASLLGVGGIGQKIRSIIEKVREPVNKAIDGVVGGVVKTFKKFSKKFGIDKLIKKAKGGIDKVKGKIKQGVNLVKNKIKQGVNWAKGKVKGLKDKVTGKNRTPEKKQEDLDKGMAAAVVAVNKYSGKRVKKFLIQSLLYPIKLYYKLDVLRPVKQDEHWAVQGEINRVVVETDALEEKEGWTPVVGSGNAYSVAFQTILPSSSYPGRSRGHHFQVANEQLLQAMKKDPGFAKMMKELIPDIESQLIGPRGGISRKPPKDWTWHHHADTGKMQLVPYVQHTAPGKLQDLFHPGGEGGFSIWG